MPWFRDRLVYDNRFLFKVGAEIVIDSACATFAEVRKRGDEFWDELEFYLSDLLVGLVLDVVLVGLLAPTAVMGRQRKAPTTGAPSTTTTPPSRDGDRYTPPPRSMHAATAHSPQAL